MKCPLCNGNEVGPSKKEGYYACPHCGAVYYEKIKDDPELKNHKYKIELFKSKQFEIPEVFQKAKNKYENDRFEIIGTAINRRSSYSLLFGQEFIAIKRTK